MKQRTLQLLAPLPPLLAATALLGLFTHLGDRAMAGYALTLGSINLPTIDYVFFTAFWLLLGMPSALLFAVAFCRLASAPQLAALVGQRAPRDGVWLAGVGVFAVAIPLGLRDLVLGGAPLTDDEGAYEFMARLLISGRLYADSPPFKEHFDIHFMINSGKYYSHYFLGWPALMVPGVLLGIPKHIGAFYSGAAVVALFFLVRRVLDASWARLATLVYLTSVLFMVGAATQLSHIPCASVLLWFALAVLKSRDRRAPGWIHAVVSTLFSLAFCMRPLTAIGFGLPFLIHWFLGTTRLPRGSRARAWLSFSVVAGVGGMTFLGVNALQNGSPFRVAYQEYLDYTRNNQFAFSPFARGGSRTVSALQFDLGPMLAGFAGTLYRMNFGLFGWPSCLLPLPFAWGAPRTRVWWWALGCYTVTNLPVEGAGVDTFGPIKVTELAFVILVLALAGLERVQHALGRLSASFRWASPRLPLAFGLSCVLLSLIGYSPPMIAAITRVAEAVTVPERTLAANAVTRALVFVGERRVPRCASFPTRHFVLQRPYNSPGFNDPVLWVNHLDPQRNAALRARYADRPAYYLTWQDCAPVFVPFESMRFPEERGVARDTPSGPLGAPARPQSADQAPSR